MAVITILLCYFSVVVIQCLDRKEPRGELSVFELTVLGIESTIAEEAWRQECKASLNSILSTYRNQGVRAESGVSL